MNKLDRKTRIYLDYAATTPVDERVLQAMLPYFTETFGNPSSIHFYGQKAEAALEYARELVGSLLHCNPDEVIFTSCGTESDNLALRGIAFERKLNLGANHILISPVEHPAVSGTAYDLEKQQGFQVELLPVDEFGRVNPRDVENRIRPQTALVSVVYANNEIGTINPIAKIGQICRNYQVPFHSDAVQAAAHLEMDVIQDQVDLLAIGAHKFYGPKGVGALYVRRGIPLCAAQTGGKQESGKRAGTQNIPYIIGLAEAFKFAQESVVERSQHFTLLRDHLICETLKKIPNARLTGHSQERLPNHASFVFENVDGNTLLMLLDVAGFACSSGSACKVGAPKPSDILTAIGLSPAWALGSLRVTLGRGTTLEKIEALLAVLPELVLKARMD